MKNVSGLLEKYKKIPVPVRASAWFVICSILQRGISFITVPIFTRLMTTEQYGVYSTYISWYTILLVFTSLNLFYGVFNNAMLKYEDQLDKYISSMQGLIIVITGGFFVLYMIFHDFFNNLFGMSTQLMLLLFLELLFTPALLFWTSHNRFNYRYRKVIIVTLIKSILNPCLGVILVLLSEQKDIARVISTVLVEIIICGIIAAYQFYKGKCFYNKEFWKYAVLFNLPLLPHYLSGSILNQGDRIMISKMVGSSQVAFYSVAYNLGHVLNMVISAITASFVPWLYKKLTEKKLTDIARVTNFILILMAAIVSLLMFFAPELLYFLASPEYAEAVYVIPPIAASLFFVMMYHLLANVEFFYSERKYVTIGSISAAVLNLILNYIFIQKYGYYAAGYTTLFCYIIYGLSHLWFSRAVVRKHLGDVRVFDDKILIMLSVIVVLITILQNFLYPYMILRYVLLFLVLVAIIWKRKVIFTEFKKMKSAKTK